MKNKLNFKGLLICPICKGILKKDNTFYICKNINCRAKFPIVNDIPILINESNSIFQIKDFVNKKDTFFQNKKKNSFNLFFRKIVPSISKNFKAKSNYHYLGKLFSKKEEVKVLVIGGSIDGYGIEELKKFKNLNFYEGDVSFGPNTKIIFDSHNIPFKDNYFDLVIVQAVLEHVLNPFESVEEIYRVLNRNGLVYSEIPFIQQVHGGKYDFTRFTYLGHIRLFRKFKLIRVGTCCGPGMAFTWSYIHFLLSFSGNKIYRELIFVFGSFTSFFFKYFDYFLINKKSARFGMSGSFFIGKKSTKILSDKELLELYDK